LGKRWRILACSLTAALSKIYVGDEVYLSGMYRQPPPSMLPYVIES
jgi:hypothetical protein